MNAIIARTDMANYYEEIRRFTEFRVDHRSAFVKSTELPPIAVSTAFYLHSNKMLPLNCKQVRIRLTISDWIEIYHVPLASEQTALHKFFAYRPKTVEFPLVFVFWNQRHT